ncbi:MAG: hypothetical protein EA360_00985 [Balneolaceae bacterium]|nr:MAG: hypothetical protein EA360_00985 [Balneolaceae bacterium]
MPVDRCICHDIPFAKLLEEARARGLTTIEELQEQKLSSTKCKLCFPYVKKMLLNGQTSFIPGKGIDPE